MKSRKLSAHFDIAIPVKKTGIENADFKTKTLFDLIVCGVARQIPDDDLDGIFYEYTYEIEQVFVKEKDKQTEIHPGFIEHFCDLKFDLNTEIMEHIKNEIPWDEVAQSNIQYSQLS